jgi:hypothetical protein
VYETIILVVFSYISDEKRVDAAVDIYESPKFIEHRLIEGDAENYLLEHLLRGASNHQDGRVDFGQGDRCLRVEMILKDAMF